MYGRYLFVACHKQLAATSMEYCYPISPDEIVPVLNSPDWEVVVHDKEDFTRTAVLRPLVWQYDS